MELGLKLVKLMSAYKISKLDVDMVARAHHGDSTTIVMQVLRKEQTWNVTRRTLLSPQHHAITVFGARRHV
jgi:hypothetical protein